MITAPSHLPDDIDALKGAVGVLERELHNRDLLIEKLKHQLAGLRRHQFGTSSIATSVSVVLGRPPFDWGFSISPRRNFASHARSFPSRGSPVSTL